MPAILATNPDITPVPAVNHRWYVHEASDSDNLAIRPVSPATNYVLHNPAAALAVPVSTGTMEANGSDGVRGLILNNLV